MHDYKSKEPLYLTDDLGQAWDYAHSVHLGGKGGAAPHVKKFELARYDSVLDINPFIEAAMEDGDIEEGIEKGVAAARKAGARYASFSHPSTSGARGDYHDVRIALYPDRDLKHVGTEFKRR